jgi:hypothetical protein
MHGTEADAGEHWSSEVDLLLRHEDGCFEPSVATETGLVTHLLLMHDHVTDHNQTYYRIYQASFRFVSNLSIAPTVMRLRHYGCQLHAGSVTYLSHCMQRT